MLFLGLFKIPSYIYKAIKASRGDRAREIRKKLIIQEVPYERRVIHDKGSKALPAKQGRDIW
jgi:hypothetical protein